MTQDEDERLIRDYYHDAILPTPGGWHTQPMPQQPAPFPSGRCTQCNRPWDDHIQGRCPK